MRKRSNGETPKSDGPGGSPNARIDVSRIEHENIVSLASENHHRIDRLEIAVRALRDEVAEVKRVVQSLPQKDA